MGFLSTSMDSQHYILSRICLSKEYVSKYDVITVVLELKRLAPLPLFLINDLRLLLLMITVSSLISDKFAEKF